MLAAKFVLQREAKSISVRNCRNMKKSKFCRKLIWINFKQKYQYLRNACHLYCYH